MFLQQILQYAVDMVLVLRVTQDTVANVPKHILVTTASTEHVLERHSLMTLFVVDTDNVLDIIK